MGVGLGLLKRGQPDFGLSSVQEEEAKMSRRVLDLAWLYVQETVTTIWRDKLPAFLIWLLAVAIGLSRVASGQLTIDEVINHVIVAIIIALPFLR